MKVQIKVKHKNTTYISDVEDLNDKEYSKLISTMEQASSNKLDCLRITRENRLVFFGKEILKDCVFTLKTENI